MFGTSLMVTSETRHFAPSVAAPSADIRSTTIVAGTPGAMSAAAGGGPGGACATEIVAMASERAPSTPPATRTLEMFLRMIRVLPFKFSVAPWYGNASAKPTARATAQAGEYASPSLHPSGGLAASVRILPF